MDIDKEAVPYETREKQIISPQDLSRILNIKKGGRKLTVDECIAIAMDNHIPLKIAEKQLKLAEFRLLESKRKLGPTVTLKWEESGGTVQGKQYTGEKVQLEGKQPLFYGGELVYSVGQAQVNTNIVRTDRDRVRDELVLQVRKSFSEAQVHRTPLQRDRDAT